LNEYFDEFRDGFILSIYTCRQSVEIGFGCFFILGEQAKVFFLQSGLPMPILGKIWWVNKLSIKLRDFSVAFTLIFMMY